MFAAALRVTATALVLSTLSFAAGVAGDLSMADPPNYGESVVLRIPPEIPADAPRAHPLPALHTASAEAAAVRPAATSAVTPLRFAALALPALLEKPETGAQALLALPKMQRHELSKPSRRKVG